MTTSISAGNIAKDNASAPVRFFAHLFSFVFHPVLVPLYTTCFLLYVHPLMFAGYDSVGKLKLAGTVFVNFTMLPAATVFLCWRLKFVDSFFLRTQKDRIIPLAATMIFYFWGWFALRNFTEIPFLFRQFLLGCFITVIVAWLANIYFRISLHGLAVGGMLCFFFMMVYSSEGASAQFLALAALVCGLVSSSRLLLSAHRPGEVYAGILLGALSQVVAVWFN